VRQIPTRREENGRHSPDQARAGLPPPSSLIRNAMYAELSMTVTILPDQSGCSPSVVTQVIHHLSELIRVGDRMAGVLHYGVSCPGISWFALTLDRGRRSLRGRAG